MPPRRTPHTATRDGEAAPAGAARPERPPRPRLGRPLPAAGRLRGPGPAVPSPVLAVARVLSAAGGTAAAPLPFLPHSGVQAPGAPGEESARPAGEAGGRKSGGRGPVRRFSQSEIFQPYLTRKYGSLGEKKINESLIKEQFVSLLCW